MAAASDLGSRCLIARASSVDSGYLGFLAGGAAQPEVGLVGGDGGVAEQAFVDVADLFDVDVAEGDSPRLPTPQDRQLHGAQDVQHHPVGDGQRECAVFGGVGEAREAGRVEQGAAVGGHPHALEGGAAVEGLAGGQQSMPGQECRIEGFFAFLGFAGLQAVEFAGDAVALVEQFAGGQQAAFLGEEQEHHPHHDGDGGFVGLVGVGGQRVGLAAAVGLGGGFGERLDQQFDGEAHLGAEGFGDFLGGGDGFGEQHRQPFGGIAADDVLPADEGQEGVAGARLLDPGQGVDDAGGGHAARAGADQSPPAAVGDDADLNVVVAQQCFHPVDRCGGPQIVGGFAQRVDRVDQVHQRTDPVGTAQRGLCGDRDQMVG